MTGGPLNLADGHDVLPRGMLETPPAAERLALRAVDAVYERNGDVDVDSLKRPFLALGHGPIPAKLADEEVVETHTEEVVWGGDLFTHFGHFLVESVARLWPLVEGGQLEGRPVVFREPADAPFLREWLDGFGVRPVYLPEHGSVRFERMFVPEQSWRLGAWIAPELHDTHLHARRGLEITPAPRGDVLWLSRSRLRRDQVAYDEGLLEWILGEHVRPVHLETMALAEQIAQLEGCRAVAGVMGSAFHGLLLAADVPDAVYLCPSFAKGPYTAQHHLLGGKATFVQAVPPAAQVRRQRREGFLFPGGHRILIPETLEVLASTVLPELLDDPRIAAFAEPGRGRPGGEEIDVAAIAVLREPFSARARHNLAELFAERGLERCAGQQSALAADLAG